MPQPPLRISESCTVDDTQADAVWTWVLRRQGLSEQTRMTRVEDIAEAALGLHAARLPSPFSTVAARADDPQVALSLFRPETRTRLMTVRCMRKTLHTLPLPLAAAAHAATLHFRERDALRQVTNSGESPIAVAEATEALLALLAQAGALFHRDIESRLGHRGIGVITARLAIKLAWERGAIAYLNQTSGWNREVRTFDLTGRAYPGLDLDLPRRQATATLVDAYFDRYGPASLRDATWWSGLSAGAILDALADSGRELVELHTPWAEQPLYMYRDRFQEFRDSEPDGRDAGVGFLAHEDVALKAYFQTRRRYLGSLPARRAFNQIGEALPTIMVRGRVIGTWAWNEHARRVEPSLVRGAAPPDVRKQVHIHADRLSETMRRGWSTAHGTTGQGHRDHQPQLAFI
jgi:hypothetical protein